MKKILILIVTVLTILSTVSCGNNDSKIDPIPEPTPTPNPDPTPNPEPTPEPINEINFIEYAGGMENIYCTWQKNSKASYEVYYKKTDSSLEIKLDSKLIRNYGTYMRADIVGLSSGDYDVKVVEKNLNISKSFNTAVINHVREGFAWVNGTSSGAYNEDGTIKDNALILYVDNNNKDSIEAEIKTSNSAYTKATGLQNILTLLKKGYETRPICIRIIGELTDLEVMDKGDIMIDGNSKYNSGLTFEGIGNDAVLNGFGIRIKNISNVEIRNLGFMNCDSEEGDNVGLQQGNDHIWVHNCDMFYGSSLSDADQAKGDGALDAKKSTYVTFSYNHFYDSGKCNLVGLSEGTTDGYYITFHHNWYDHSDSRHPRVRYYTAHVYNNYYDGNSKYGIGSTLGSSIFSEGNYFRNCKYPMLISMQGSDVFDESTGSNDYKDMPTFSEEDGGIIKSFNNYIEGAKRFVSYAENQVDFDAYVVENRNDIVPDTVVSHFGNNKYNNFDTQTSMYSYNASSPQEAVANVKKYAGRVQGGDFKWTFTDEDDKSYDINTALKQALLNYSSKLILSSSVDLETFDLNISLLSANFVYNEIDTIRSYYKTYESLSLEEKEMLTNSEKLINLYNQTDDFEVGYVIELIDKLKVDTKVELINAAKEAYNKLSDELKAKISNYNILLEALALIPAEAIKHNFTTDGLNSSYFTFIGNLSTSKGSITYDDMTLGTCLKLESSTSIKFTTTGSTKLTLVFNGKASIRIDGVAYDGTGILEIELDPGDHELTKKDSANLYYIVVE